MNVEGAYSPVAERPSPSRPDGSKERRVPPFVVVGRFVLLLAAAAALAFGVVHARSHDRADLVSAERYVCPMHPTVTSGAPGDCPICNMALVPIREMVHGTSSMPEGGRVV